MFVHVREEGPCPAHDRIVLPLNPEWRPPKNGEEEKVDDGTEGKKGEGSEKEE